MIYGNPTIKVVSDEVDGQGVRTLVLRQIWQPSRAGLPMAQMLTERPPMPDTGMPLKGVSTRPIRGAMETQWRYQGNDESASFDFAPQTRETSEDSVFEPQWGDIPIILHPAWGYLKRTYGGKVDSDGNVTWPERYTPLELSALRNPLFGPPILLRNPMYGRKTYRDVVGGVYTHRYVDRKDPPQLWTRVGGVFKTGELPGKRAPRLVDRDWLKSMPRVESRGNLNVYTEMYQLSDIGGWPSEIHPPVARA